MAVFVVMVMVVRVSMVVIMTAAAALAVAVLVAVRMIVVVLVRMIVAAAAAFAVLVAMRVVVIVIMAAAGAVHVLGGGAGGLAGGAALARGGEQLGIDLRLGVAVIMRVVVVMIVVVIMIVTMRVAMLVAVLMAAMRVAMAMRTARNGAAARGGERRLDETDLGAAQLLHHLHQHVIVADSERAAGELGGGVAVAELPGDAGERLAVGETELGQPLRPGGDGDVAAVLQKQRVAGAERRRLGEVELEFQAALAAQHDAPAAALVVVEHDGIDGRNRPGAGGNDGGGAQHHGAFKGKLMVEFSEVSHRRTRCNGVGRSAAPGGGFAGRGAEGHCARVPNPPRRWPSLPGARPAPVDSLAAIPSALQDVTMPRLSRLAVLALAAGAAACGRLGLSDQGPDVSYAPPPGRAGQPPLPESLQPLPPPTVQSSALPPPPGASEGYPPAGQPQGYPSAAAAPAPGPAAPPPPAVSADRARSLTMADLAGDWVLMSGADNCRVTMSLTSWAGGRRAMSRGCTQPELQRISAWMLDGKQVILKGSDGAMVASLYSAEPEQFAGSTIARQPISLSR